MSHEFFSYFFFLISKESFILNNEDRQFHKVINLIFRKQLRRTNSRISNFNSTFEANNERQWIYPPSEHYFTLFMYFK